MSKQTKVKKKPDCDLAGCSETAEYDAKTRAGPWAYLCQKHFKHIGVGLGLGKGQRLIEEGEHKDHTGSHQSNRMY